MTEPLSTEALRWRCDPARFDFETTADLEPLAGIVGQDSAVEAVRFGLQCGAPGQNVFIRGLTGTGRMTLIAHLLDVLQPTCGERWERCYVRNFSEPYRPRLISVEVGRGRELRRMVHDLATFIRDDLSQAMQSDMLRARRASLDKGERDDIAAVTKPFEADLQKAGLTLVTVEMGPISKPAVFPLVDGEAVPPEQFEQMHEEGKVSDQQHTAFLESRESYQRRFEETAAKVQQISRRYAKKARQIIEETARMILTDQTNAIAAEFPGDDVRRFLDEVVDDVVENGLSDKAEDPLTAYGVNIVLEHERAESCPIVVENTPTLINLLGTVERSWKRDGAAPGDHLMVRGGSLLRADGGFLILDARDVLSEPGAWKVLVRTLRSGQLEIVPPELSAGFGNVLVKPEPIPVRVRVLMVGDNETFYMLDRFDPDFGNLFKVLAEFDSEMSREPDGPRHYASVLARLAREEELVPFHRTAVAELAEHGARIAARRGKLTARLGRVSDLAREAAFLASERHAAHVEGDDVREAIRRTKHRAGLPSRRFHEFIRDGTILVQRSGEVVGQINGLAVMSAGPLTYGFPARITASIGAGRAGIIDIEGRAALSGAIHTKGFHILGGLLRRLLRTDHPLAFSASLAFEQSYGGIDGDSASAAEIICLLSALTNVPIRQSLAITGAIDQLGRIQPIGGVNEKIEGFFDTLSCDGPCSNQGVVIPESNAGDLMLRWDVVEAAAEGRFHVYAVSRVEEAIELMTGMPAGERDENGEFPEGTLLRLAVEKAHEYWLMAERKPGGPSTDADADAGNAV